MEKGKLIIVSAPSGAGKTTLVHYLLETVPNLEFSVSCTTRPARINEKNGEDYYFITVDEFKEKIKNGEFVEYEEVYPGVYYGTLKSEVEKIIDNGTNVIFDIDVEGGMNLKDSYPQAFSIFISPPSVGSLKDRLTSRDLDNSESIDVRLQKSELEMRYMEHFDKIIVNDNLEDAKQEIQESVEEFLEE